MDEAIRCDPSPKMDNLVASGITTASHLQSLGPKPDNLACSGITTAKRSAESVTKTGQPGGRISIA